MSQGAFSFSVDVLHQNGSVVLGVTGELDIATGPILRQAVAEIVSSHLRAVTLDLAQVTFVDVAGLRALIAAGHTVSAAGAEFQLRSMSDSARYVVRLANFRELEALMQTQGS